MKTDDKSPEEVVAQAIGAEQAKVAFDALNKYAESMREGREAIQIVIGLTPEPEPCWGWSSAIIEGKAKFWGKRVIVSVIALLICTHVIAQTMYTHLELGEIPMAGISLEEKTKPMLWNLSYSTDFTDHYVRLKWGCYFERGPYQIRFYVPQLFGVIGVGYTTPPGIEMMYKNRLSIQVDFYRDWPAYLVQARLPLFKDKTPCNDSIIRLD